MLRPLPTRAHDMTLNVCRVPLSDVECVTKTLVKIGAPIWYLHIKKGRTKQYTIPLHVSPEKADPCLYV